MNSIALEGFMIPGLHFKNCCIWVLHWTRTPRSLPSKMTEVWILWNNGRKTCYVNSIDAIPFFKIYHDFDEVICADIHINLSTTRLDICVNRTNDTQELLRLESAPRNSLKYQLLNFLIKHTNKVSEKGRTETGKSYENVPKKIQSLSIHSAILNGNSLTLIHNSKMTYDIGDGKPSKKPIINYCTHQLEKERACPDSFRARSF